MTIFDLRGTEAQNSLVTAALVRCDFPFERLLPGIQSSTGGRTTIPVEWADLSRYATDDGKGHSHVHDTDGEAHTVERPVDGRMRVLGLAYYPPTLKVVLDLGLQSDPELAAEVFLAEGAHMVDFTYMTNAHRLAVINAVHRQSLPDTYEVRDGVALGMDGHECGWFDVGPYRMWCGEAWMEGLCEAFAPTVKVTIELGHPVNKAAATRMRYALIGPDLFGTKGGRAFHRASCPFIRASWRRHKTTWATPEDAALAGRRACRVCRPSVTSW